MILNMIKTPVFYLSLTYYQFLPYIFIQSAKNFSKTLLKLQYVISYLIFLLLIIKMLWVGKTLISICNQVDQKTNTNLSIYNYNFKKLRMECIKCIFFCCDFESTPPQTRPVTSKKKKTRKSAIETRLITKYKKEQFVIVSDADRKAGKVKAYCCPICTYYFTKILACNDCMNCLCYNCFESYDIKNIESKSKMKCPFCNSTKSLFSDYEMDPHSYFDTTNKGFLSKQQRLKLDSQLGLKNNSKQLKQMPSRQLDNIQEQRQQQRQQ